MIYKIINDKMRHWALNKTEKFTQGKRDEPWLTDRVEIGFLGEALFWDEYRQIPKENYIGVGNTDFIFNNVRIDIKTQKLNYEPNGELHFDIPEKEKHRSPDIYVCVVISNDKTEGWLVGWIKSKVFFDLAEFQNIEDRKKKNRGAQGASYSLKFKYLHRMEYLYELFQTRRF